MIVQENWWCSVSVLKQTKELQESKTSSFISSYRPLFTFILMFLLSGMVHAGFEDALRTFGKVVDQVQRYEEPTKKSGQKRDCPSGHYLGKKNYCVPNGTIQCDTDPTKTCPSNKKCAEVNGVLGCYTESQLYRNRGASTKRWAEQRKYNTNSQNNGWLDQNQKESQRRISIQDDEQRILQQLIKQEADEQRYDMSQESQAPDYSKFKSDRKAECKLDVTYPEDIPGTGEFEWEGQCVDGLAEGYGVIRFFVDNMPYWIWEFLPGSGVKIHKGDLKLEVNANKLRFKLTACERDRMQIEVVVPKELNMKSSEVFWKVVDFGSKYGDLKTIVYQGRRQLYREYCPRYSRSGEEWTRDKEIVIYQGGKQVGWAKSDRWRKKSDSSYRYGSEVWKNWKIKKLIVAEKHRKKVFNEVKRKQREEKKRRAIERAKKARLAAEQAEKERQAKIEARIQELMQQAKADAEERDDDRPADSFCFFSCDPTEQNARLAFGNRLREIIKTPAIILKFRKTNGVSSERDGVPIYELHYKVHIELPRGYIKPSRGGIAGMIAGASAMGLGLKLKTLMDDFDETKKGKKWTDPASLTGTGKMTFRKTEKGWEGYDGVIYPE